MNFTELNTASYFFLFYGIPIFILSILLVRKAKWKRRNIDSRCADCTERITEGNDIYIITQESSGTPCEGSPVSSKEIYKKDIYSRDNIIKLIKFPLLYDSSSDPSRSSSLDPKKIRFLKFVCTNCYEKKYKGKYSSELWACIIIAAILVLLVVGGPLYFLYLALSGQLR
jgi:hypothetical protein